VTRHPSRSALGGALFALGLAGCELVIGGESHATIRSQDGAIESVDSSDAASETHRASDAASEAYRASDAAVADVATHDDTGPPGPPGPCMAPPPCIQSQGSCGNDCTQMYNACTMGMPGPGDPHGDQCKKDLDDCTATCQASCIMCAGCPKPPPECMVP
jgi:hypothetical protein